jgi:hypothetical protein
MSLKDAYFARMASQFRSWDAEIAMLIQKAAKMDDISRARFTRQLQPMRAHRDAAYRRLQQIRTASETSWRSLQTGVDSGWMAMKHALALAQRQGRS